MIERVLNIKFNCNFKIMFKIIFICKGDSKSFVSSQNYSSNRISLFNKKIEIFSNIIQEDLMENDSFTIKEIIIQNYRNKKRIIFNERYLILKKIDKLLRLEKISNYLDNKQEIPLYISKYFMTKNLNLLKDFIQWNNPNFENSKILTINIKNTSIDIALKILQITNLPFCIKKKSLEKWFGVKFFRFLNLSKKDN